MKIRSETNQSQWHLLENNNKMVENDKNKQPKLATDNEDFGFGSKWTNRVRRFINEDGRFNVMKSGEKWQDWHLYQTAVTISWGRFFVLTLVTYIFINTVFAILHLMIGIDSLTISPGSGVENFFHAFYFSRLYSK